MMLSNIKKTKRSFTIIELLISLMIIAIVSSAIIAMKGPFSHRQQLMSSAMKLVNDLRLTQQFARSRKDDFNFYGLRLYSGIGPNDDGAGGGDRYGYKIVRYDPQGVGVTAPVVDLTPTGFDVIKTSEQSDIPSPATYEMFIENTFFEKRVNIKSGTTLQVGEAVVFNPEGSATSNGGTLLTSPKDKIILEMGQRTVTIDIIPLTGYVKIE